MSKTVNNTRLLFLQPNGCKNIKRVLLTVFLL